jgi:hypothetical protein
MKKILAAFGLLTLTPAVTAQVSDGSVWSDGLGTTATVDVVDTAPDGGSGLVTVVDATGFTGALTATMASTSTTTTPQAQSSVAGSTNSPHPHEYRVRSGKLQKKNSKGQWVDMRRSRKKGSLGRTGVSSPGEEGGSLPGPGTPGF